MRLTALLLFLPLLHAAGNGSVVAKDGSGDFRTVQEAVNAAPSHSHTRFTIHLKPGKYDEIVVIPSEKTWLALVGDDAATTIITGNRHTGMPFPPGVSPGGRTTMITFDTPTVFVQATDFLAENITFENSAGNVGQAVALTIMADRGVFRNCRFIGYQDTLLAQAGRQYFDRCYIEGATDFIFGGSRAFFDHCHIHATANGYLTAANTTKDQPIGYVFSECQVTGAPGVQTFLGRPWRPWAATVFLNTEMSEVVRASGWNNWNDPSREKTVRYAEFGSRGAGGEMKDRVAWARRLASADEYSMEKVLSGDDGWNPLTGATKTRVRLIPIATKPTVAAYIGDARFTRGPDGVIHAVWAGDLTIGYAHSRDRKEWTDAKYFPAMAGQDALDIASPNIFYDDASKQFIITWSSTLAKNAIQAFQEEVGTNPRIWYSATRDFQQFSPAALLFDNNYAARDGVIVHHGARYALVHTDAAFPVQSLRVAFAPSPLGPWGASSDAIADKFTNRPAVLRANDVWWIYGANIGGLAKWATRDFLTFTEMAPVALPPEYELSSAAIKNLSGTKIALAGDSTVNDEGGWGIGFRASFMSAVTVVNLARNGRSTKSFRDEGSWAKVLAERADYVLIQFGHNDVPGKGADRETDAATTYRGNLSRYIDEVRGYGGKPVLVTSIVRRNFDDHGKIKEDSLVPYVAGARAVAQEKRVPLIDLYAQTKSQAEMRGVAGSEVLGRKDAQGKLDTTHLGPVGQKEIGVMAARGFIRVAPEFFRYFHEPIQWRDAMHQTPDWYGSDEAIRIADNLLLYQHDNGGWDKNIDMAAPLGPVEWAALEKEQHTSTGHTTMDNDATWTQTQFLARVPGEKYRAAVRRGLAYMLAAQYPNGGWPQFYPLRDGYWDHITYNDDAMTGVMETLRLAATGQGGFSFLDQAERTRARDAVARGVQMILKTQVTVNGKLTVWCAQHDEHTLAPVQARAYEHISLSGQESVGVVEQLMAEEHPTPEVIRAVEAAVAWFRAVKITGIRVEMKSLTENPALRDRVVVEDAQAPPLWARFYEIGTNRPIFSGRDGVVRYRMDEIEQERRVGYRWYVDRPAKLLDEEYPAWKARLTTKP